MLSPVAVVRSDEDLMVAHIGGDPAAFRELFERYSALVERVLARHIASRDEVRDLVQQTFLQIHRARLDFRRQQSFRAWAFTIALNLRREYFRRARRRPTLQLSETGEPSTASFDQAEEAKQTVVWALQRLPKEQSEVIELHWRDGLSFAEVAVCTGISESAAKVRAHRGYARLRALLEDDQRGTSSNFAGPGGIERGGRGLR